MARTEDQAAGPRGRPALATGCARDGVSVGGKPQPPLWDPGERLIGALRRDLGVSRRFR